MRNRVRGCASVLCRVDGAWIGAFLGALFLAVTLVAPFAAADKRVKPPSKKLIGKLPITELGEDEAILHALNRLGFGPRPGDIERVRQMGLEKWVQAQLHPESLDEAALARRLERYPTLAMSSSDLLREFPNAAEAARRAGMTPEEYRKQMQERAAQLQRDRPMEPGEQPERRGLRGAQMDPARLAELRVPQRIILELSMAKLTRAIYSERQLEEVMADFWFNHFNVFANKGADRWLLTSYERDAIRPHVVGKFRDLLRATAEHPAMLFYLDNWLSADPEAFARMEQELLQRRQRFDRLFGQNPRAMPVDPLDPRYNRQMDRRNRLGQRFPQQGQGAPQPPPQQPQRMRRGLNENYARELMELHTLGVDGGYSQQDVIEVARAFTGWTMRAPRRNPEFYFDSRVHDTKAKTVLGQKINFGGKKDGEAILDLLARHPNTAKFISTKLARRFVADEPPAALVERMSKRFLETDGDIRAVLETMFYSPEFWARSAYRAKIKRPFELVASTARALGAEVDVPLPLVFWSARIGEPLYQCQPPTGYSDKAEAWVNTGALLNRLNFALALAAGRTRGARLDLASQLGEAATRDPKQTLARAIDAFLAGQVSDGTRQTLEKQLSDPQVLRATLDDPVREVDAGVIAGLVLGSPEFQRR